MRRPLVTARASLAAAAAVVLLTACGGSDDNSASSTKTGSTTSATESQTTATTATSAPAGNSAFCRQVAGVLANLQSVETDLGSNPQVAGQALEQAAEQLGSIQPPRRSPRSGSSRPPRWPGSWRTRRPGRAVPAVPVRHRRERVGVPDQLTGRRVTRRQVAHRAARCRVDLRKGCLRSGNGATVLPCAERRLWSAPASPA